jgi:hypothetical protein
LYVNIRGIEEAEVRWWGERKKWSDLLMRYERCEGIGKEREEGGRKIDRWGTDSC